MIIDVTQETAVMSVISQLTCVAVKLSVIVNIRKYREFHKGHHFISMAMEVHNARGCDMDCFIRKCACFFHDKQLRNHLSLYFCIQFFKQCVNNAL